MMRIVAGKRYFGDDVLEDEEEAGRFKEIVGEAFALSGTSNPGDHLPMLNWISNYEKRIVKISKRMDEFFQRLVDERRNKKEACLENTDSMIDHLLSLQHSEPHYYTDQTIKGLAMVSRFDCISFSIPTHTHTHTLRRFTKLTTPHTHTHTDYAAGRNRHDSCYNGMGNVQLGQSPGCVAES